jgi:hypothetical protein
MLCITLQLKAVTLLLRRFILKFSSNIQCLKGTLKQNKLRGLYSTSELYRLSDRHLLAEFSANFCG